MTWALAIGLAAVLFAIFSVWLAIRNHRRLRDQNDQIYLDELKNKNLEYILITPTILESYGFKIYGTKDITYAVRGAISMTERVGYWEAEIQGPGKMLWRDKYDNIGELIGFCLKHGFELNKQDDE